MSLVLWPLSPQSSISRTEDIVPTQVDACPRAFGVILNWLRYRQLILGNVAAKEVFYCLLRNWKTCPRHVQVLPVADFFHITDLSDALGECLRKEEQQVVTEREAIENTADRIENVLENIQGEISSCADKLKDIRGECANVATNLEDIWRIKCELSNLVSATKAPKYWTSQSIFGDGWIGELNHLFFDFLYQYRNIFHYN